MNTNLKDNKSISKFIKDHIVDDSVDINHESKMIMYRFLSEVERIMEEEKIQKKDLASKIGTSSSYITQIFRGNKLLNLPTIAKIQHALNFKFKIEGISNNVWYAPSVDDKILKCIRDLHRIDRAGFWVSRSVNPYQKNTDAETAIDHELYGDTDQKYSTELKDSSSLKIA